MRYFMLLMVLWFVGCASFYPPVEIASRSEGLEVEVQGFRFLFSGVHEIALRVTSAGDGMLYTVNDREIFIRTGRQVVLDGEVIEIQPGEVRIIPRIKSAP